MPTAQAHLRGEHRAFPECEAAGFADAAISAARIRQRSSDPLRKTIVRKRFSDWSEPCFPRLGTVPGCVHVAAFAAHALATTSVAAILAGKPTASAVQSDAADSPFAAMLAQMMSAPAVPAAPANSSSPINASKPTAGLFSTGAPSVPSQQLGTNAAPIPSQSWIARAEPASALLAGVPSYEQSIAASVPSSTALFSQPLASQMTGQRAPTGTPGFTPANASASNFAAGAAMAARTAAAQPSATAATASNPPSLAQQAAMSWLQQTMNAPAMDSALDRTSSTLSNPPAATPTFGQSLPATPPSASAALQLNRVNPPAATQQAAVSWLQQNTGAFTTNPSNTAPLPAALPSYAQQLGSASYPANNFANIAGAQQAAASSAPALLQQMIAAIPQAAGSLTTVTTPNVLPSLPSTVASYAQSLGSASQPARTFADTTGVQTSAAQLESALLQQIIAASARAGGSITTASAPNAAPNPLSGIASYAQSLGSAAQPAGMLANDAKAQPDAAQSALLQQIIAASARAGGSAATTPAPNIPPDLPVTVASFAQSLGSAAQSAGVLGYAAEAQPGATPSQSTLLQQIIAASARAGDSATTISVPNASSNLPLGVASDARSPASQPTAAANTGRWPVNAPDSTILAANNTQSVAAMFGVPAFPASMAYATPDSKASEAPPATASSKPASWTRGTIPPVASSRTNSNVQPLPGTSQAATAQSQQSAAPPNPTPVQSAASDINKAVSLAQAAQNSVRQGHSPQVTEAQTLPLHFDLSENKNAPIQAGSLRARSDNNDAAQDAGDAAKANATNAEASVTMEHAPVAPQAASAAAATPSATPATTPSSPPTVAGPQIPSVPVQQLPQIAAAAPAAASPSALPAPDLNTLALKIAAKSLDGSRQFDIRLDPAELGRVDVRLALDGNGNAQAHLAAERPETLSLLQNNASALTRALQDSGVQVANDGLQFSLKGQERQADGQQRAPSRGRGSAAPDIAAVRAIGNVSSIYGLSPSGEGVNILV